MRISWQLSRVLRQGVPRLLVILELVSFGMPVFAKTNLQLVPADINLGDVWMCDSVRAQVKVINNGADVKFISEIVSDCGCTIGEMTNRMLAPTESAWIEIQFQASFSGHVERHLTVKSESGIDELVLRAHVVPRVRVEPSVLNFPDLQSGRVIDTCIVLTNLSPYAWNPQVARQPEGMTANVEHVDKNSASIKLFIGEEAMSDSDWTSESLQIKLGMTTNCDLIIPVSGSRSRRVVATPSMLNFGIVNASKRSAARSLVLSDPALADSFKMLDVKTDDPSVIATLSPSDRGKYRLDVVLLPAGLTNGQLFRKQIRITTNDPQQRNLGIKLIGSVVDPTQVTKCCGQ